MLKKISFSAFYLLGGLRECELTFLSDVEYTHMKIVSLEIKMCCRFQSSEQIQLVYVLVFLLSRNNL